MASLPWSRALSSIFTGVLLFLAFAEIFVNRIKLVRNFGFYCLIGLVFLCILDGFRADSIAQWLAYVNIKLPLMLLSFAILVFNSKISEQFLKEISIYFCLAITSTSIASATNYWLNYSTLNALVLQSKPIPILGEIHHITFSVFCAFAVFVSLYYAITNRIKWLWIIAILNLIGLHILTARTGLLGFYFASILLGIVYIKNNSVKMKWIALSVLAILILPLVAFFSFNSFHNRVVNSWVDIKTILHKHDANYQSLGMRIEASKTAIDLIKKHLLLGVGCTNLNEAMAIQYETNHTNLFIENRILPHNQFILETAIHGIGGLLLLLLFFAMPFIYPFKEWPVLFVALWALLFFASMFECIFDRQHGIILVSVFWFLYFEKRNHLVN